MDGLQEVEDGTNGEGVSFEGRQLSENDLWRYVIGCSCDSVSLAALLQF